MNLEQTELKNDLQEQGFDYGKIIIGSSMEGSDAMFDASKREALARQDDSLTIEMIVEKRGESKIYLDAEQRYENTVENLGYKKADLGIDYPSLDEWVEFRIRNNRGTKFFPSFLQDSNGNIRFAKTQIRKQIDDANSLLNEAIILSSELPVNDHVKLVDYFPGDQHSSAMIVTEAIPLSEGRTAGSEEWKPYYAIDAVKRIKKLENYDINDMQDGIKMMPQFGRRISASDELQKMLEYGRVAFDKELIDLIEENIDLNINPSPTFVHGDLCLKNIIIKRDKSVTFVDWETAATGFLGQDAGKMYSGLIKNEAASEAFLSEYLGKGENFDEERFEAIKISVLSEVMVHINWRVGELSKRHSIDEMAALADSVPQLIDRIKLSMGALINYKDRAVAVDVPIQAAEGLEEVLVEKDFSRFHI
jgi:thiamine kinase-like enzyme